MPPDEPPDEHRTLEIVSSTDPRAGSDYGTSRDRDGSPGDRDGGPRGREDGPGDRDGGPGDRDGGPGDATTTLHFEDPAAVQHLLSSERVDLVRSVLAEPPASIRALARRLGRNPGDVNRDVHALAEHGVVALEAVGRAKRPTVPYDRVRVEVELARSEVEDGPTVD